MNFNSLEFAIFLPVVFAMFWMMSRLSLRYCNLFILLASFVFYGWVDYRFLGLIIFSIVLDYIIGLQISQEQNLRRRKLYLSISILGNLGMLGYFKYYNFFVDSLVRVVSIFGHHPQVEHLQLVLPVGISFYTFQTMSYTIDVYRRRMDATRDFIAFGAFVSFFPQLVAGPIERAEKLLPQFMSDRYFDFEKAVLGLRQMLWGFFKKVVIADSCARILNPIYASYESQSGSMLALAALMFAIQIYCDFSGYSDIAIGTARLFGVDLSTNFRYPFFSRNIGELWNRWHTSLSTWFRDYVYIPLGGSRGSRWHTIRNIIIVFLLSGLWHGAAWHFVVWGLLCGLFLIAYTYWPFGRLPDSKFARTYRMLVTFITFVFSFIFFRSDSIGMAMDVISRIFSSSFFDGLIMENASYVRKVWVLILFCFVLEWRHQSEDFTLAKLGLSWPRWIRYTFYYLLVLLIFLFDGEPVDFIYFRF